VDHVVVLDDLSSGDPVRLPTGADLTFVQGSILDPAAVEAACADVDAVVHLAALISVPESLEQPVRYHDVNVTGTLRILEAVRRRGAAVVLASSAAVYGANPPLPITEDTPPAPQSVYASSKLAAEAHTLAYAAAYGLPALVLRFFNVFGPLQGADHSYAAVVPAFVSAALARRPLTIHGDGLQTRDMVSAADVGAVIADAVERRVTHAAPVNLAFGSRRTILDIADALEGVLGRPLERHHTPSRPGDVRHSQADATTLRHLFPTVSAADFTTQLRATVDAFARA
jgi:UDP-glucose 4-epimerase